MRRKESSYESLRGSQAARSYSYRLETESWGKEKGDGRRSRSTQNLGFSVGWTWSPSPACPPATGEPGFPPQKKGHEDAPLGGPWGAASAPGMSPDFTTGEE